MAIKKETGEPGGKTVNKKFTLADQTRKGNKKHPNWKGGNETVTVCR